MACPTCGRQLVAEKPPAPRLTEAELIDHIQQIRGANNTHWMDILRLAMKHAPARTKALLKEIEHCDGEVRRLTKELAE